MSFQFKNRFFLFLLPILFFVLSSCALFESSSPSIDVYPGLSTDTVSLKNKFEFKQGFQLPQNVEEYCRKVNERFLNYGWGHSRCLTYDWLQVGSSHLGDPLIWLVFGNELSHRKLNSKNSTLIMCGVHGDEITPIKFCFDLIRYLTEIQNDSNHADFFNDRIVIVAPIVSPDGFFIDRPTRFNARGVDLNRNFPTRDWEEDAYDSWVNRYRSDPRRYPGESALSENETIFQVELIRRYRPDKIISVHAPLTILDYDGPTIYGEGEDPAKRLLNQMAEDAQDYTIMNWPFFPGSLGNWAGNERNIPTYTLELPSSDNRRHRQYWDRFRPAIISAIEFHMLEANN